MQTTKAQLKAREQSALNSAYAIPTIEMLKKESTWWTAAEIRGEVGPIHHKTLKELTMFGYLTRRKRDAFGKPFEYQFLSSKPRHAIKPKVKHNGKDKVLTDGNGATDLLRKVIDNHNEYRETLVQIKAMLDGLNLD